MFAGFSLHGFKPQIASTEGKTSGMSAIPALAHVLLTMVLVVTLSSRMKQWVSPAQKWIVCPCPNGQRP
jgi:hypothetical protein